MNSNWLQDMKTHRIRGATVRLPRLAALLVLMLGFRPAPAAAQLTELYAFPFNSAGANFPSGQQPVSELIQGADGNYYTTTSFGGAGTCPGGIGGQTLGCGAVVKITPSGTFSVVYSFPFIQSSQTAPNGVDPLAGLVQGSDGNFYGTTGWGGTNGNCALPSVTSVGCGTVFKLTPAGKLTVLHSFCGINGCGALTTDGWLPMGRLIFGSNGNLYGTTNQGGFAAGMYNSGTIFRISRSGAYTILHMFSGNAHTGDGANPAAGLIQASDGNFYGTTQVGGANGDGTVFKMTASGSVTVLHSFAVDANGYFPEGALVEASDGNLYGTCYSGGANSVGTVFRISKTGSFQKIYDFSNASGNIGYEPKAGLIQASDGKLYGTTYFGGTNFGDSGTLYQLTTSGTATLLASFNANTTGFQPADVPLQGSDGNLYLSLLYGGGQNSQGVQDQGTIDRFTTGLAARPPVITSFSPAQGLVGAKVTISGSSFIGATVVSFNGTHAAFTVKASGFIVATVPVGATSGKITVTTPAGTAASKKSFTVQ
jgi:uncharacterized repeat protein (TIGR03803 family)